MMTPAPSQIISTALFSLIVLIQSTGALELKPQNVEIKTITETATIAVTDNGSPVPASAIQSVKLYVDAHDYDHMIRVEKADGQVTIHPTEFLELGVYDVRIKTSQGSGSVRVVALQDIVKSDLAAQAKRQGVTEADIKAKLGISQSLGQERVTLDIQGPYYVGQRLRVTVPVQSGRTATWWINGELVASEGGALDYVLELEGLYDVAYVEKEGENTKAVVFKTVQVVAEPAIRVAYKGGSNLTLSAPTGFGSYEWNVDGVKAGTGPTWEGRFDSTDTHEISVRATDPESATARAFRMLRFVVTPPAS